MANITKNQIKSRLKKLVEKLEEIKDELNDLQSDVEEEIDNIEPYENKKSGFFYMASYKKAINYLERIKAL